jgi:hypothetical protein
MKEFKKRLEALLIETQEIEGIIITDIKITATRREMSSGKWEFVRHNIITTIE